MSFEQQRNEIAETVLDLAKGFAALARASAPNLSPEHALTIQAVLGNILKRAEQCDWHETADLVRDAEAAVGRKTSPGGSRYNIDAFK